MPLGHTNTFGCNPFNGNDYWKLATVSGFGWGQEYAECIKPEGNKAIFDLWRSFVNTPEALAARRAVAARSILDYQLVLTRPFNDRLPDPTRISAAIDIDTTSYGSTVTPRQNAT